MILALFFPIQSKSKYQAVNQINYSRSTNIFWRKEIENRYDSENDHFAMNYGTEMDLSRITLSIKI